MRKPVLWSSIALGSSLVLSLIYRFSPDFVQEYFEIVGAQLLFLIPVAVIIMVLVKNQRRDDRSFKQGGHQSGGGNPGYNQGRQN